MAETELEIANRHLNDDMARFFRQAQLVSEMRARGEDVTEAKRVLATLRQKVSLIGDQIARLKKMGARV